VLGVADLTDRRSALEMDHAHLAGRQAEGGVVAFLRHDLRRSAGGAGDLPPAAFGELDVVHHRTNRDVPQRKRATHPDIGARTGFDHGAHAQLVRRQDVALIAVRIDDQSDAGVAVGVVLDGAHPARHAVLVALEVDDPVPALVAAPLMPGGDAAVVVPSALALHRTGERLLRLGLGDLVKGRRGREPASGRCRLVALCCHVSLPF